MRDPDSTHDAPTVYSVLHGTMADLTFPVVERAARAGALALLPVGVIEEHGPHLPLGVDTYVAIEFVRQVRDELERRGVAALVAPPFYWGINSITDAFPGSFTCRPSTMRAVLVDIFCSLQRWGLRHIFALNFHGDDQHYATLAEAIQEARRDHRAPVRLVLSGGEARNLGFTGDEEFLVVHNPVTGDDDDDQRYPTELVELHADAVETSFMARYYPQLVDLSRAQVLKATTVTRADIATWERGGEEARRLAPLGYVGDPAAIDVPGIQERVEWLVGCMADAIAASLEAFPTC